MTESYELPDPDVFTTGTVGPPGRRVFYIQVRDDNLVVSLRCEKQQVAALAEYLDGLLDDLEPVPVGLSVPDLDLTQPVNDLWTIGSIGVAYDEPGDRIVVVMEEYIDEEDEEDLELAPPGGAVRVHLSRAQAQLFIDRSRELVEAGRPSCRFCGLPMDPEGHPCPRMN